MFNKVYDALTLRQWLSSWGRIRAVSQRPPESRFIFNTDFPKYMRRIRLPRFDVTRMKDTNYVLASTKILRVIVVSVCRKVACEWTSQNYKGYRNSGFVLQGLSIFNCILSQWSNQNESKSKYPWDVKFLERAENQEIFLLTDCVWLARISVIKDKSGAHSLKGVTYSNTLLNQWFN